MPDNHLSAALHAFGRCSADHQPLGDGHIHQTYAVGADAVLQRINTRVFTDVAALCHNAALIRTQLREVAVRRGCDPRSCILHALPSSSGAETWKDPAGGHWRMFERLPGQTRTNVGVDEVHAAARAFGAFVRDLAPLDADKLRLTIPDFHNLPRRWTRLDAAFASSPPGEQVRPEMEQLAALVRSVPPPRGPVRICHNDAKLGNLLWAEDVPPTVIDYDTVMPGYLRDDLGDLLRSLATPASEDEPDLRRVVVDAARVEAVWAGFLEGLGDLLLPEEVEDLRRGAAAITIEQAVRFLTDYLEGDRYYPIDRPGHNLDRARNQIRLAEQLADFPF